MSMTLQQAANSQVNAVLASDASHDDFPATVLSRVLHNEPNIVFMIPDEEERRTMLPWLFRSAVGTCELSGKICVVAGEGAALWIGPEHNLTFSQVVRNEAAIPFNVEWRTLRRSMKLAATLEALRKQLVPGPHWYLMALGSESSSPAEAIGKSLMEPVLSHAHGTGVACYLETFNEKRLGFYQDYGFRIAGAGQTSGGGPPFWAMIKRRSANVSTK
jgi:hypothetical protein